MTRKTSWETVAIVGVGLIGGSVGLAVRKRKLARRIIGIGHRVSSLRKASRLGVIDEGTTKLQKGVADADLIVVATPVDDIVPTVQAIARVCRLDALITDVGSTKATIVAALGTGSRCEQVIRGTFIGSHPIAGSEKSGPEHANAELFSGRNVVITPTPQTDSALLTRLSDFWRRLGARVSQMTPAAHDEAMAAISHLPHIAAAALAGITPVQQLALVGTGWLDTTRIASGETDLWTAILLDNQRCTTQALDRLIDQLQAFRRAMERDQRDALKQLLQEGKIHRDAVGN